MCYSFQSSLHQRQSVVPVGPADASKGDLKWTYMYTTVYESEPIPADASVLYQGSQKGNLC